MASIILNLTPGIIGAAALTFPIVGIALVALRLYARRVTGIKLGADDWLIFAALVMLIALGVNLSVGVFEGVWGRRDVDLNAQGLNLPGDAPMSPAALKWYTVSSITYWNAYWMPVLALGFTKLSLLCLYFRVFGVKYRNAFGIVITALMTLVVAWTIAFFMQMMLFCPGHASAFWSTDEEVQAEDCKPLEHPHYSVFLYSDVGTDLLIMILPIPSILRLHMSTRRKMGILAIFLVGTLSLAASITRSVLYSVIVQYRDVDIPMVDSNAFYWSMIEVGLAFIVTNLPVISGLVRREGPQGLANRVRGYVSFGSRSSQQTSMHSRKWSSKSGSYDESMQTVPRTATPSSPRARHSDLDYMNLVENGDMDLIQPEKRAPVHLPSPRMIDGMF